MKARYRYRFYPTNPQKRSLAQLFGCVRVVFNDALALCKKSPKLPKITELSNLVITQAKKTTERVWLGEVSSVALQQSLRDLGVAYQNFFASIKGKRKGKKVRPPRFKKRRNQQSAKLTRNAFSIKNAAVYLAKIGTVKPVWSRELPSIPSSVTIIKDSANRYFLSFVVEIEKQSAPPTDKTIGIDLGIKTFATFDTGEKRDAPKPLKKNLKRLRKLQCNLSRKKKGSKHYEKSRLKVAKLHAKIKDLRSDFLHKLSTDIIRENQTIVLEDLNVSGMISNRKLSRAISDLGWREFRTILEAKAEKYERDFRVIDRWEPTSQTCSCCGFRGGKLDLSIREWQCLNCETIHDRDVNAAVNIKVAGGLRETLKRTEPAPPIGERPRDDASRKGTREQQGNAEQETGVEKGVRLLLKKQHSLKRQPTRNSLNFRCLDRLESPLLTDGEDVKGGYRDIEEEEIDAIIFDEDDFPDVEATLSMLKKTFE